jgi:cysteine desulfurase/selenocysteine lyase
MNVDSIKRDFPILAREVHGKRLIYLDSAATSQKPLPVLAAVDEYYRYSNANVHRGVYLLAEEATELYEMARKKLAAFIGASSSEEIIFTRNASEAINLVAYTWARRNIDTGDVIALTPMEHHSNLVPWQILAEEKGSNLAYIDLQPDGTLDLDSLDRILETGRVKLVTVAYVSALSIPSPRLRAVLTLLVLWCWRTLLRQHPIYHWTWPALAPIL